MLLLLPRVGRWNFLLAMLIAGLAARPLGAAAQCTLPPPVVNANSPLCEGSILQFLSSGVPNNASYLWNGPNGFTATRANPRIPNVSPTEAGWYKLTITFNGCSASDSVEVVVNPRPSVSLTASGSTTLCQGDTVILTANGAATYIWSNGATTPSIAVTQQGNYSVTGFSANNCSGTGGPINVNVIARPAVTISAGGATTFCRGGSVTLTANTTPANAAVLWSTGATGRSITVTQSGNYTASATSGNGCTTTSTPITVTVNPLPTPTISASGATTFCPGDSVRLTATGGGTYRWNTGATTASIVVRQSGSYSATVTSAAGCSATTSPINVTVQPAPTISVSASGPTNFCQGGSVTLTATASPGAIIRWSNSVVAPSITVRNAGTYIATARTPGGCSTDAPPIVVTVSPVPTVTVTASGPTTFCQGGSVTLTANGASTYTWSNGATTPAITVTQSGTYTVTGANTGCSATASPITVNVAGIPAAPTTTGASRCGPGSVTLTAAGGGANATFRWYDQPTGGSPLPNVTGPTYTTPSLSATTTYYVSVVNGAGCEGPRAAVTATINASLTATITASGPTIFCEGGSVTLSAPTGPGYTYLWSTGATTSSIVVTQIGRYLVTVTANGCSVAAPAVAVLVNPIPVAPAATGATLCGAGSATLTASGAPTGSTYQWYTTATGGSPIPGVSGDTYTTPNLTATTTYYVAVLSDAGCEGPRTAVTATVNAVPSATITAAGPTTFCSGDSVRLTATGGTTYLWSTGATTSTITVRQSGAYTVAVTSPSGCTATSVPTTVTVNPVASAAFAYATSTYCLNGTTNPVPTISGTAGGTFAATPAGLNLDAQTGTVNLAASAAGTYTVTYQVTGTCPASLSQPLTLTTAPSAQFGYNGGGPLCAGDANPRLPTLGTGSSIGTVTATPAGLAVEAASGAIDLSQSVAGTYTVTNTIPASGTCAAVVATTTVTILAAPTATITAGGPTTFCQGDSVTLTASGGTRYQWSNGATTATITVRQSGTFTLTAYNVTGCAATSGATTVTVNPQASAAFTYPATTYCLGSGTAPTPVVTGTAGGTFTATPAGLSLNSTTGEINLTGSQAGTYTVTYAVVGTCPAQQTTTLTFTAAPLAQFSYAAGGHCAGSVASLAATLSAGAVAGTFTATPTGLNLNTQTGAIDLALSAPGTYTVTNSVAASGVCAAATATATVTLLAAPAAVITPAGPTAFCVGGSVVLNAPAGAATYQWSTGESTPSITVAQSGTFTVTVTNGAGCSATSAPVAVTVDAIPPTPAITQQPQGSSVLLTSSAASGNQWFLNGSPIPGATAATYLASAPGTYTVVVTSAGGCASVPSAPSTVIVTGVAADVAAGGFQLFPNPSAGTVQCVLAQPATSSRTLLLLDALGRVVRTATLEPGAASVELRDLRTGVYVVRYGATVQRLVVE